MLGRTFKTAWFAKAASKARITGAELCKAIRQVALGQADDLGGGVFNKRLDKNRHRSIVLASGEKYWVYAYLFAKKDRATSITKSWQPSAVSPTCTLKKQIRTCEGSEGGRFCGDM